MQAHSISLSSYVFSGCFYWFEVSVRVSLAVDVGHRRHDLSEKHPGLLLRQTVLCYDIVKQLPTYTILRREKFHCNVIFRLISLNRYLYMKLSILVLFYLE